MTAVATLPVLFQEGDHASRPAASAVGSGALYSCTTHSLIYQTDGSTWTTWATLGGGTPDLDAVIAVSGGQDISDALSGAAAPDAGNVFATMADVSGGSVFDPIASLFGAADTAFEFTTSSLSGLTGFGTPDVEDADTTVPDHYYIADNASGTAWCGRYLSIPSYPFTIMGKVDGFNPKADYNEAAVFLGNASPGKMLTFGVSRAQRQCGMDIFTNPTTFSTGVASGATDKIPTPFYVAMVAASTSSVTGYCSMDGIIWERIANATNPSMTISVMGICFKSENSGGAAAAYDWFRIWNSSKTFLTGV